MRYSELINEAINLPSKDLFIYAMVVAEAYDAAPDYDPRVEKGFDELVKSIERMEKQINKKVNVQWTEDDPGFKDILQHEKSGNLPIYTGDSEHPVFTPEQNQKFRLVHDYMTHIAKNRKAGTGKEFTTHGFNLRGEINTYLTHAKIAPKASVPVLFTEVVGQVCYKVTVGNFPPQKATVLDGFDYWNIGKMSKEKQRRYNELKGMMENPEISEIQLHIKEKPVLNKKDIAWKDVAPSTGWNINNED